MHFRNDGDGSPTRDPGSILMLLIIVCFLGREQYHKNSASSKRRQVIAMT
jgi:hypothetical protein